MKNKIYQKIVLCTTLLAVVCLSILFFMQFIRNVSVGADNSRMKLEVNLDKYINYNISDQDKGTLIQYDVKVGNNEEELREYIPTRKSELNIGLNQIDGKYPYDVKVVAKSTEATNGKTEEIQENYQYDNTTGTVVIKASNENENGESISSSEPSKDAKDEYLVICYYDTYIEQPIERELDIKISVKASLFEDDRLASAEDELTGKVKENIGELTNISYNTPDIANGYIKSNIINGTNYDTVYTEKQSVLISKKESQEKIKILENNNFVKANNNNSETEIDVENKGDLVYKSTKIRKSDVTRVLGLDGEISILDNNQNLIATINKDTEFEQDGTVTINYENEPQAIIIKTSNIQNEGILNIENTKVIKSSMLEINNSKIKTVGSLIGVRSETINETEQEIEVYSKEYENKIDIKDSKTNVTLEVNNDQWTNKQQNEITFDVYTNANTINDNMLKNPKIKIELPSQVEKVILGNSSVVYANGLELQDPYLETNKNGNIVIVANLIGEQTSYNDNSLGLITDVKISATVILKKDIEGAIENVNLIYANQYTLDGSTQVEEKNKQIKIENYKEEVSNQSEQIIASNVGDTLNTTSENVDGLKVEVVPVRGDTTLKDGDTVYEGEFIKYNIKVTNTSDKQIDNVKVVGTIPEGTVYGELEADYENTFGKYEYSFDENIKEKTIQIGSLGAGEISTNFYEVKINDLGDGEEEKEILSNIKVYVGDAEITNYQIKNIIKSADVQVFLAARKNITEGMWTYVLKVKSNIEEVADLKLQLPKEFVLRGITNADSYGDENSKVYEMQVSDDNLITTKINLTTKEKEYIIVGNIDSLKAENQTEESKLYLNAIAKVFVNNTVYSSNENRIEYNYENVSVSMTSDNEGEEIKYEDEIEYKIEVKSIGQKDSYSEDSNVTTVNLKDYLPEDVIPVSVTYQNWEIDNITENEEAETYTINDGYKKVERTKEINGRTTDEKGNQLPDIDIDLFIPFYESSTVIIKCKAGLVEEKTKIENNATVSGDYILSKTTNTITHTILPYDYEDNQDPDNPDNPDNPDGPDSPDKPDDKNEKYSISGIAWLDENEDGKRQTNEKFLDGITVMLVNTDNSSAIKAKQVTDANGSYKFSGLEKGKYIIIFNYDTDTYSVTEYQKSGVSSSLNSDAATKEITLLGTQTKAGVTDIIDLGASILNIDIGLIKNKICDLKLDKYISKVTVKTNSGTKEQSYNNTQLAKVEIKSKEIQGAIIVVEYKIVITNEGEIPTSVNKVIDYLPDGLEFSSELNKSWTTTKSGEFTNTSISNQKIDPGKSIELTLVATKTMTSNSTGTFTNIAEIGQMSNSDDIKDIDSTPGNKVESEDDYSKADLIISISTGAVLYISIILGIMLIIAIVVYLNVKYGIKRIAKISMFVMITVLTIFINVQDTFAANYKPWSSLPESASWKETGVHTVNGNGYSAFTASGYGITGYCAMETFNSATGDGLKRHLDGNGRYNTIIYDTEDAKSDEDIFLKKVNNDEDVYVVNDGNKLKIGPFKIKGNATSYKYTITGKDETGKNKTNYNPEVTDETTNNGVTTFYLKINYTEDSISNVRVTGYKTVTTISKKYYKAAFAYYIPYSDAGTGTTTWRCEMGHTHTNWPITSFYHNYPYQDVLTYNRYKWTEGGEKKSTDKSHYVSWTIKNGDLEIIKQDKNDSNVKLKDVEVRVQCDAVNYDKTFKTGEDGKITLKNLKQGTYTITELSNPHYGYTVMATGSVKVKGGMKNTCTLGNQKQTGNLKIIKQDADSEKNLEGVSFKIKKKDENKYIQVKTGDGWKKDITGIVHVDDMQTVDTENEATIFTTNSDGIIEVRNILKGTYYVEEVSVGDIYFGYEVDDDYITWSYTSTANKDNTGSGKGHIATVEVVARASYNTKEPPKEENRNEIVVFKNKRKYIKLSGYAWEDKRVGGKDNKAGNEKCDVEENTESNKEEDKRLANVLVKLYSWEGKLLGQTITDEKGNYVFGTKSMADINGDGIISIVDVTEITRVISSGETNKYTNGLMDINNDGKIDKADIEKLQNIISLNEELIDVKIEDIYNSKTKKAGYIEFTYNGLNYETVSVNVKEENTNKVAEISSNSQNLVDKSIDGTYLDNRTSFNESWAVIENNKKIDSDGNVDTLDYNHNNYASSLSYPGGITGYNEQKYPIIVKDNTNNNIFNITARTETNVDENSASKKFFGQNKTIEEICKEGKDTIKNINLGVKERAQPDLALIKNIYSAKVTVNGYEHTYNYEDRFNKNTGENKKIDEFNPENNEEKTETNVRVKFNQKYGEKSFTRAIYPSDVKETQDKDFSVKVVYKITLKNESGVLYSKINSLVDYFDARYTIEEKGSIGTGYENGEIKDEINYKLDKSYQDAKYRKLIIDCNTKINPNESNRNIYVEYTLTRDSVKDILFDENWDEKTNIEGLENIVEINSYSTYSDKDFTKSYAGIDSDSNPGSTIPGNKDTYEDDTDYAPGLILEVANSREITGTVFEDNAVDPTEGGTNRERLGNGKFDDGEKTISGVQVGLYKEADFENGVKLRSGVQPVGTTTYEGDNKDSTGKDGTFTIKDFVPGEYRIVYTWGDDKYTVEDYKSTIWTSANKDEKEKNKKTWYRVNTNTRYSDAKDNYATRLKIDGGDTSIDKKDSMDSMTNSMTFGVELDDIYNRKTETSGIDKVTFSIENIDFGVIERPRQSIDVTKRAKSMKMTLANGQVIADAKIVEKDGKLQLEQQVKGVIYTEPSDKNNPKNGQIKAEIDNELIQGSKVEIEYEIKVQNNSEIDYDSEKYYCYGEKDVEIVKIKASGVYDYLDNTMIANDENTEWETIKDYNEKVSKPTVIEEYLHKSQSSSTDASGNTEIRIGYEKFEEQYSEAIGNWRIENIITARKKRLADKTILHNANLEGEIAPGEFNMASLTASKILTNTDEIELNNDVEITEVTRTAKTGRKVTPKYTSLYDRGETVTITTPTGENKNYILITIVAISFFVILGTGIVFIKKKILK